MRNNGLNHFFVLFGTRPEAIKLFPVIKQLKLRNDVKVTVCVTAQHRNLLDQVLKLTKIVPDLDLDLMEHDQSLDDLSARILLSVGKALDQTRPGRVIVQGDTATAMFGALAAYYRRIPVAHVEAGLRSGDIYAPWPEEVNRKVVSTIADQHFAPTQRAADVLLKESIPPAHIHVTGNTVVDALLIVKGLIDANPALGARWEAIKRRQENRRIVLVTCHRRESFGDGVKRIADALVRILDRNDVAIVLPLHPNPNVRDVLAGRLTGHPRAELIEPQEYSDFVSLLLLADIVLTDSGGIQEEAPTLGKPVLVMRDTTERPEGIVAGTARLVGTDRDRIIAETFQLIDDKDHYLAMARAHNPFGDGKASERIVKVLNG
jgi:UDP-N-acetylglucosamine 2-epimerase (non-hydrolysing)